MVIDGSGDDFDITDDEELNFNQFENMPGKPLDFAFFSAIFNNFLQFFELHLNLSFGPELWNKPYFGWHMDHKSLCELC